MTTEQTDVLIAGGGPTGMVLALALAEAGGSQAESGPSFTLVRSPEAAPDRPIALAHGSRLLLERLGAFPALAATAIETIHVSHRGGFGRTLIRAADYRLPALGYVVPYRELCAALERRLRGHFVSGRVTACSPSSEGLHVRVERLGEAERAHEVRARLLVLADGGPSPEGLRAGVKTQFDEGGRDYGQSAVVTRVRAERPHRHIAWERFTSEGPLALLPDAEDYALVWSTSAGAARALRELEDSAFLARLGAAFGGRLGRFLHAGERASFPLALRYARKLQESQIIVIGNAAQTLHPVAGQGLNLGLRDAWELAQALANAPPEVIGSASWARAYAQSRALDRTGAISVTDALIRVFSNANPLLALARGAGLAAFDLLPPARRFLARRMMFGARAMP